MTPGELDAIRATVFVGPLAPWADSLAFHDHSQAVASADLANPTFFDDLLNRFARDYPTADRRAVASFWSQHYFSRLLIGLTAFCLAADGPLDLDLAAMRTRFCPVKGTPLCFHLRRGGPTRSTTALVKALYDNQVAETVAAVKRHVKLSERLLWENAGSYGMWVLGEIGRTRPASTPTVTALLSDPDWPRAACAMLTHLRFAAIHGSSARRRVCCLRYRVPGIARCAGICPLSEADGPDALS